MSRLTWHWTVLGALVGAAFGGGLALTTAWQMRLALADFGATSATSEVLSLWLPYPDRITAWLTVAAAPVLAAANQGLLLPRLAKRTGWIAFVVVVVIDGVVGIGGGWLLSLFKSGTRHRTGSAWPAVIAAAAAELSLVLGMFILADISTGMPPPWFEYGWIGGVVAGASVVASTAYVLVKARPLAQRQR